MYKKKILSLMLCLLILVPSFSCVAAAQNEIPTAEYGKRTIKNMLSVAVQPIGSTMYVWGGGHTPNARGSDSGIDTRTIGLGKYWPQFYSWQTPDYDYENFEYRYRDGLDCSGFIGWTLYNTFNSASGKDGYVMKSTVMARSFAKYGYGAYVPREKIEKLHAGDIMSTDGHVFMGIGECSDGSRVLVHSSPPCVQITGTAAPKDIGKEFPEGEEPVYDSEAIRLADYYMSKYWPELNSKYPKHSRGTSYLTDYDQMVWGVPSKTMSDPEGYQAMDAYHVLKDLFNDDGIIMETPLKRIAVNGVETCNSKLKYPFYSYNDIIYFPLTWENCGLIGLGVEQGADGSLMLHSSEANSAFTAETGASGVPLGSPCREVIFNGEPFSVGEYPTVKSNNVVYLPLTWDILQKLGLTLNCDSETITVDIENKEKELDNNG